MKKRFVQGLGKFALPIPNLFPIFRNIWNHQPRNLTWTTTGAIDLFFSQKKIPRMPQNRGFWRSLILGKSFFGHILPVFRNMFFSDARCSPWLSRPQIQNVFCILKAPFLLIDFGCFSLVEMVKEIVHFFKNQSCWAVRFALAFNIQKSTSALFFWSCREWYNFLWAWLTIIGPPRICKTLDN